MPREEPGLSWCPQVGDLVGPFTKTVLELREPSVETCLGQGGAAGVGVTQRHPGKFPKVPGRRRGTGNGTRPLPHDMP